MPRAKLTYDPRVDDDDEEEEVLKITKVSLA
jgi:hypothetical protein